MEDANMTSLNMACQLPQVPVESESQPLVTKDGNFEAGCVVLNDALLLAHNAPSLLLRAEDFFEAEMGGLPESIKLCDLMAGPKGAQLIVS